MRGQPPFWVGYLQSRQIAYKNLLLWRYFSYLSGASPAWIQGYGIAGRSPQGKSCALIPDKYGIWYTRFGIPGMEGGI